MRLHRDEESVPSYYVASAGSQQRRPSVNADLRCDVAIIGGGYTGLSAALTLAEAGKSVLVCEAKQVGWGASGRNGGQVFPGLRLRQNELERLAGVEDAHRLWQCALDANAYLDGLIQTHRIACDLAPGLLFAAHKASRVPGYHAHAERMHRLYGYDKIQPLDRGGITERTGSHRFFGGILDHGGRHLHPLKLAYGLAAAAERAGADIREMSPVEEYRRKDDGRIELRVNGRAVTAEYLMLCGNGYLSGIDRRVDAAVLPINSFMLATEPLPAGLRTRILLHNNCAGDSRHLLNYWRKSADGRLIFGGGESFGGNWNRESMGFLRRAMVEIYPELRDIRIDYAWGGTLANTRSRMPMVRRLEPNVLVAAGYSGLGILAAPYLGMSIAKAIDGTFDGFDVFSRLPARTFPGGPALRWPTMVAGLLWYGLLDRI